MRYWLLFGIVLLFSALVIAGRPDLQLAEVESSNGRATVVIPENAVEVAPGVFSLGTTVDNGRLVEGYAIVDYKEGFGKPTGCNNDGKCQGWEDASCADCSGGNGGDSNCYGFLAKGAKWKTIESYVVNPANTKGLDGSFVTSNLATNIGKWETASTTDILGAGSSTTETLVADTVNTDGKNEVYFADISESGAIGITIVWGIFIGPPQWRELVEWDQVYDDADFDWSADCLAENCSNKMDFENIATHELGHSVGLDDLYTNECSEETMYGYAGYGEVKKRSLEAGDIKGIKELYN